MQMRPNCAPEYRWVLICTVTSDTVCRERLCKVFLEQKKTVEGLRVQGGGMEEIDMKGLYDAMEHRTSRIKSDVHRYLYFQLLIGAIV